MHSGHAKVRSSPICGCNIAMRTTEIRGTCPVCYRSMKSATDVFGQETPMHGDIAICLGCGEVSIFDLRSRRNLFRRPTYKEAFEIEKNVSHLRLRAYQNEFRH